MKIKQATVSEVFSYVNIYDLLEEYSNVSTLDNKVTPHVAMYEELEKSGLFDVVIAVDGDKIVGIVSTITTMMPHYSDMSSTIESQFIYKDYRKHGTWSKMLDMITSIVKSKGSTVMFINTEVNSRLDKILSKSGYEHTHKVFKKSIL